MSKPVKEKISWTDSDQVLYLRLKEAPQLDGDKMSVEYREYMALNTKRIRFKLQEHKKIKQEHSTQ